MTMNGTWGFKSYDHDFKSTKTLLRNLIDIASKGGNYLLNIGPDSKGNVPPEEIERLHQFACVRPSLPLATTPARNARRAAAGNKRRRQQRRRQSPHP